MGANLERIRARSLRSQSTDAEQILWANLRRRQLEGFYFRRQHPLLDYIVDFVCMEAKVIIELDGGQHQQQAGYDARRDARIAAVGFTVLRFWNNQVIEELPAVLEVIVQALRKGAPPP